MVTIRLARVLAIAAVLLPLSVAPSSAGVCDLTTKGSTCTDVSFGGALYTNQVTSATRTFYIDPFLQLKSTGVSPIERGYNTGGTYQSGLQQAGETSNLLLTDVPITTIGGVQYREFLLAINEPNGNPQLSLDQLQIFLSPTQNVTGYSYNSLTGTEYAGWVERHLRHGRRRRPEQYQLREAELLGEHWH